MVEDRSAAPIRSGRSRRAARLVAAATALTGVTALLGWAAGFPALTTLGAEISMKSNAAVCLVLLGVALWRRASGSGSGDDPLTSVLAVAAATIGGLTLVEHLAAVDLRIDVLLFHEPPGMPGTAAPGRMGPPAAASFLLLGTALTLAGRRAASTRVAVQTISIATAFVALLPLVGYGYGATQFYGIARLTAVSLPTALCIEALAIGVLLAVPGAGLVEALRGPGGAGRLARRALAYSTVVPLVAGWLIARGLHRGLYEGAFAVAFLVLTLILSLTLLTWRDAVHLRKAEVEREAALAEQDRARQALSEERERSRRALEVALERERQARAIAEDASRSKDAFLAVLSHELRNPLAPIRNSLFLLARDPSTGPVRGPLAVIDRQVTQLTRLVEDLLDVSRINLGKVRLQRARLDLAELARRTVEDHRAPAVAAGLELEFECADEPVWVEGDATRLAQVIGNLVSNAVKFTPAGGRVEVSVERDSAEGGALLRVRDTGVGIDAGMRARLFQPFAQADRTLDRSRGGLGLGLALVKGLVELHGGAVDVSSGEGGVVGAEFRVRLPLASPPARVAENEEGPRAALQLRVLLIEDNPDSAETLRMALELTGYTVQVAHDGTEGLELARRSRPDVVLCDIGLPGIDGYEVARALRRDAKTRGAVLIAVTGYAGPEDQRQAAEAGFDHHVAKPADLTKLLRLLADVSPLGADAVAR